MNVALVYLNDDHIISRGAGYVAMAVKQAGHNLAFYDTAYMSDNKAAKLIANSRCDAVLISTTSLYAHRINYIAQKAKRLKQVPVVVGGPHAIAVRGKVLDDCPDVDHLCVGEGEEFIQQYLQLLGSPDLYKLPGLGYRANDCVVINPPGQPTDLANLDPFDHGLFNRQSVVQTNALLPGFTYVFATRGCPYNCTYCSNNSYMDLYGKQYLRTQCIDTVIEELLHLKRNYPARVFYFGDEMALFDPDYADELFSRVYTDVRMPYGCMCRVECITPRMVKIMRNTGCRYVAMGVECGNEQFRRDFLNRRMSNQRILEAFRMLRSIRGIYLTSYNMKGYPVSYDNQLTQDTLRLNKLIHPNHAQITWYYPLPGTRMYDYCVERDLINWDALSDLSSYFRKSIIKHPVPPELDAKTLNCNLERCNAKLLQPPKDLSPPGQT